MMDDMYDDDDSSRSGKATGKRRTTRNESEKRRRDKLNVYITELASMVPTCETSRRKLDKTTILKMTVNYMRIHNDLTGSVLGQEHGLYLSFLSSDEIGQLMDESLNGFLFVLSNLGEIVYVSKNVTSLLGLDWEQVRGSHFTDFVHPEDKAIVTSELDGTTISFMKPGLLGEPGLKPSRHSFEIRMACNPGNQLIENNGCYERVRVIGYTDIWKPKNTPVSKEMSISGTEILPKDGTVNELDKPCYFIAVGCLSRPAPQRFVNFDESSLPEFESRHTMDGKFLFVDPRSIHMTGYWPYELLGTSIYNYVHHDDMSMLAAFHQSLLEFGEVKTEPYRMRSKGEQWVWMKSRSFISYNHWNSKPEFFCSKNMAISDKQDKSFRSSYQKVQGQSTSDQMYLQKDDPLRTLQLTAGSPNNLPSQPTISPYRGPKELVSGKLISIDVNSSRTSTFSDDQSRSHSAEDDIESNDSVDLSMSYEELESFIEAQRQLHDQLILKHTLLEEAITKQKHQLQAVQQQMLLNLQAQLTLDPSKSKQLFEEQFQKAKEFSEMHQQQENRQSQLLQTMKKTRKRVEKRNRKQLKYYREKHPKQSNTSEISFTPSFTQNASEMTRSSFQRPIRVSAEENQQSSSRKSLQEQYDSTKQEEDNQSPLVQQANAQGQLFATQTDGASRHGQSAQLTSPTQLAFLNAENTTGQASSSVMSPRELQPPIAIGGPTTLANIQNLLTASSQNPQAMQRLLSSLQSQPEVAQTLLDLLKQAQASETSEKDSLLFSQSLQNTTEQFSTALNTTISSFSAATEAAVNRSTTSNPSYHTTCSVEEMAQQPQQQWHHNRVQTQQQQQRLNNPSNSRNKINQTQSETLTSSKTSLSSQWMSSLPTQTQTLNQFPQGIITFDVMNDDANFSLQASSNDKQKEQGQPKDYFSTFSSKELEAMILTSSPQCAPVENEDGAASSFSVEERKLQQEESSHSALLIEQQQLLQMHQDQRKQYLIGQQEQLLMAYQQTKPPQTSTASNQDIFVSSTPNQDSTQSLLANSQPGTSTADEEAQPRTNNSESSQPSTSWATEAPNFELNDADKVVLNMLLAQSSMDTLFDPNPWPESDSLLEYLNMNPDLTSD